ncbi:helix-turn-helix domain-containing protein [Vibrio sp. MA40-2]|uniref:helix-turn-helix domain-containing protein n=1 Tax=Vibrio sp. MA40-2 TaxID=3391828 RepID=UPI0039A510F3
MQLTQILINYRTLHNLTQSEVVERLSQDSVFANLDVNTYSRWERGSTTPNLTKIVKILCLLNEYQYIEDMVFTSLNDNRAEQIERIIDKRFSVQHPGLSTPFIGALAPEKTKKTTLTEEDIQRYTPIHARCFDEPLESNFRREQISNIELYEVFDVNDQIIGHFIFQIAPLSVCIPDLPRVLQQASRGFWYNVLKEDVMCLHILSEYSSSSEAFMYRNKIYKDVLLQRGVKIGLSKVYDLSIFQLLDKRDSWVFEKGPLFSKGIRWANKRYRWIKCLHRVDQLLSWELLWVWDMKNKKPH